jgi:hypothetical protein
MGELEGRSRKLSRRAKRLEQEVAADERARQAATERELREAISRLSTAELEAMRDHFEEHDRDDEAGWGPVDEPLMERLLQVRDEMRAERAEGDFPWRAKTKRGEYGDEAAEEG